MGISMKKQKKDDINPIRGLLKKGLFFAAGLILLVLTLTTDREFLCLHCIVRFDPLCASMEEDPCYGEDGKYYIYTADDYLRFAGYLNRESKDKDRTFNREDTPYIFTDAVLMADIDLGDSNYYQLQLLKAAWTQERLPYTLRYIHYYNGIFEGNNYSITQPSDDSVVGGLRLGGLFMFLEKEGVVRNVTVTAENLKSKDSFDVGILCDHNLGLIKNCQVQGRVEGSESSSEYVGGIAGKNYGTIEDCVNYAEVICNTINDHSGAGGIAGLNDGLSYAEEDPELSGYAATIKGCINYGNVRGTWLAGGICASSGYWYTKISDSGNEGEVSVRFQKVQPYLEEKNVDESTRNIWEDSMVAGIAALGDKGIMKCYNTGRIFIEEEGINSTYGITCHISGNEKPSGCVNLKGTVTGRMRHENVMELNEEEMELWKSDHDAFPYVYNSWQFDLEEAKEKIGIVPLDVIGEFQQENNTWFCEELLLRVPEGFHIRKVSEYAICMEADKNFEHSGRYDEYEKGYQMWLLKLPEDTLAGMNGYLKNVQSLNTILAPGERMNGSTMWLDSLYVTDETSYTWGEFDEVDWLHPLHFTNTFDHHTWVNDDRYSFNLYKEGQNAKNYVYVPEDSTGNLRLDNVISLPLKYSEEQGYEIKYLMLFTNKDNNYRPDLTFAQDVLSGFYYLPFELIVQRGDTLYALAEYYTGEGSRYIELKEHNNLENENLILEGQKLSLPKSWLEQ